MIGATRRSTASSRSRPEGGSPRWMPRCRMAAMARRRGRISSSPRAGHRRIVDRGIEQSGKEPAPVLGGLKVTQPVAHRGDEVGPGIIGAWRRGKLPPQVADAVDDQLLLGGPLSIDAGLADAGLGGDGVHGRAPQPPLDQQPAGCLEHRLIRSSASRAPPPRRRGGGDPVPLAVRAGPARPVHSSPWTWAISSPARRSSRCCNGDRGPCELDVSPAAEHRRGGRYLIDELLNTDQDPTLG